MSSEKEPMKSKCPSGLDDATNGLYRLFVRRNKVCIERLEHNAQAAKHDDILAAWTKFLSLLSVNKIMYEALNSIAARDGSKEAGVGRQQPAQKILSEPAAITLLRRLLLPRSYDMTDNKKSENKENGNKENDSKQKGHQALQPATSPTSRIVDQSSAHHVAATTASVHKDLHKPIPSCKEVDSSDVSSKSTEKLQSPKPKNDDVKGRNAVRVGGQRRSQSRHAKIQAKTKGKGNDHVKSVFDETDPPQVRNLLWYSGERCTAVARFVKSLDEVAPSLSKRKKNTSVHATDRLHASTTSH